jgi:inward rectifier potassium channel
MSEEIKDPGIGTEFSRKTRRIINSDGTYNIIRKGSRHGIRDVFRYLTEISWWKFFGLLFSSYVLINLIFTVIYMACGLENITNVQGDYVHEFMQALYFSVQTFTTVGYGLMAPKTDSVAIVAGIEAFVGLLSFALATGLLYGRFSRPTSRLLYSDQILYSKYQEGYSLKLKFVNERESVLLDVEAKLIMTTDQLMENGFVNKRYYELPLEISRVDMMPFSWTLVHKIDEKSPLSKLSKDKLESRSPEFLVLVKGFTEVFGRNIHSRKSYTFDDIVWNKNFARIFKPNYEGIIEIDVRKINELEDE